MNILNTTSKHSPDRAYSRLLRQYRKTTRRLTAVFQSSDFSHRAREAATKLQDRLLKLMRALGISLKPSARNAIASGAALLLTAGLAQAQTPKIVNLSPATNANAATSNSNIIVTFSTQMTVSSLTAAHINIRGGFTGYLSTKGTFSGNPARSFNPDNNFLPGELITVSVTGAQTIGGTSLTRAQVYQFRAAVAAGTGRFNSFTSGSLTSRDHDCKLGDLDGDGDLDAVIALNDVANQIWLNNGDRTFATAEFGEAGADSYGLALGDLDNDGDLDVIVANGGSTRQNEIWLNNGDGTFTSSQFGSGQSRDVAVGDLDGDGDLDAVIANYKANQEIWLNNGDATFTSSNFGGNDQSFGVDIGDLDGDGFLDVIIANYRKHQRVWINNGDATFSSSTVGFSTGSSRDVTIGDLDNDGDLDAIFASYPCEFWQNNGDGSFATSHVGPSISGYGLAIGDLDNDGDLDAAIANLFGKNTLWINNGDASFSTSEFGSHSTYSAEFGDIDGDGDLDMFLVNSSAANQFYLNKPKIPNSPFTPRISALAPATHSHAAPRNSDISLTFTQAMTTSSLTAGNIIIYGSKRGYLSTNGTFSGSQIRNFNPDSKFQAGELVSVTVTGATSIGGTSMTQSLIQSFRAGVDGGSADFNNLNIGVGDGFGIALGDLNGDGNMDAIVANNGEPQDILLNNGDASFSSSTFGSGNSRAAGIADLDGDGDLDAIILNSNQPKDIWINNGDATFSSSTFGISKITNEIAFGDLDGDGDIDAIISSFSAQNEIWLNNGDATFATDLFGGEDGQSYGIKIGDIDNDGDLDAVIANGSSQNQGDEAWFNNGDATFISTTVGNSKAQGIALGDIDGDGDLDALTSGYTAHSKVWVNNGDGTFAVSNLGINTRLTNAEFADFDADGDLDAFLTSRIGRNYLFINDGTGSFTSKTSIPLDSYESNGLALGDLDGDGDVDAMIANGDGDPQEIWLNQPQAPTISAVSPNTTTANLSGMRLDISGTDFETTTAQISTLNAQGTTNGNRNLVLFNATRASLSTNLPPGLVSTAGTLTLTIGNQSGTTSTTITVLNDQPTIATGSTIITIEEDNSTALSVALGDIWPGVNSLVVSATTADITTIASLVQLGATSALTNILVTPVTNANGTAQVTVTADDGEFSPSTSFTLNIIPVNDPPTISTVNAVVTINEDTSTNTYFTLDDIDTSIGTLELSATSSNLALISNGSLAFGATGATTSLLLDPAQNATGAAIITVTVDDGEFQRELLLTVNVDPVNDAPVISTNNTLISTDEDQNTVATVSLSDIDTPLTNVVLSATSSDQSIIPDAGLSIGTTDANTQILIAPATNANGTAHITVSADDGEFTRTTTFTLTVDPVNDPPTISAAQLTANTDNKNTTTAFVNLADIDTPVGSLVLSATSGNQSIIQDGDISIAATAANTQLILTPVCGAVGTTPITVTLSDGEFERTTSFVLNVLASAALSVSGATSACPNFELSYSLLPNDPLASHVWSVQGGTIVNGQGTEDITLVWDTGVTSGVVSVTRTSATGCTEASVLNTSIIPLQALADFIQVSTSGSTNISVLANDIGTGIAVLSVDSPANGSSSVTAGSISYIPNPGFTGADTFNYIIQDNNGCTTAGIVNVFVQNADNSIVNLEYIERQKDRVGAVRGLRKTQNAAVSPDGRFVYVAGRNDHSIAIFERDTLDGSLTYDSRVRHGSKGVLGLKYASDLQVSADGTRLYATGYGDNAIAVFNRNNNDGSLSFVERKKKGRLDNGMTINGMNRPRNIAVSPDDLTVIATGYSDNSLAVFRFTPATGVMDFIEFHKDGLNGVNGLKQALGLAFSPDAKHVYVAGSGEDAVAVFAHDIASGSLTFVEHLRDNTNGIDGIDIVSGVAVSPDGQHVYTAASGDDALALFDRNPLNGKLTFVAQYKNGANGIVGLNDVRDVNISPDGNHVYAAASSSDAVSVFTRNLLTGELTFTEKVADGVNGFDGLSGAMSTAVSPNGQHIYAAGPDENSLAVIYRNRMPLAVGDVAGNIAKNTGLSISPLVNDSDKDGHTLTISAKTDGTLGTVNITGGGTSLQYLAGNTLGADQFTYTIEDGHSGSSTATVHVTVAQPKSSVNSPSAGLLNDTQLNIAPNPATEHVNLSFTLAEAGEVLIHISDLQGTKRLSHNTLTLAAGQHQIGLDLFEFSGAALAAGVYFVELEVFTSGTKTQQIVAQFIVK